MKTKIESRTKKEYYIVLPQEFIDKHDLIENDNLSVDINENGDIVISPFVEVEFEATSEACELLVKMSCDQDLSVNDVVKNIITEKLQDTEYLEMLSKTKKEQESQNEPTEDKESLTKNRLLAIIRRYITWFKGTGGNCIQLKFLHPYIKSIMIRDYPEYKGTEIYMDDIDNILTELCKTGELKPSSLNHTLDNLSDYTYFINN